MSEYITIPGRCGDAAIVRAGERIKIVNITGEQVVDTWAFNLRNPLEYMSMQHVRPDLNKGVPGPGDRLVTNCRRPVLTMLEDTSNGVHDTFMAACDIYRYMGLGVQGYHANCTDNMYAALRKLGIQLDFCPCPLNLWMNTPIVDNKAHWLPPLSKAGDYVVLEAHFDCVVVMSACPQDILPINGKNCVPSDIKYKVYAA